jgi:hypothetical protein
VLVAARDGPMRDEDARFSLEHLALPRATVGWDDALKLLPRGTLSRLVKPARADPHPTSYGRRRMPLVAMLGAPGTEIIPRWFSPDRQGLRALLEEIS